MNGYHNFECWLNGHIQFGFAENVKAVNFNLYEADDEEFDVQCIGSPDYDAENPDWACNEIFTTGEHLFHLHACDWECCLQLVTDYVRKYLSEGTYSSIFTNLSAVTIGFVDGDLEVVFENT